MITIQNNIISIDDPTKNGFPIEISLDEDIYPDAKDIIMAVKELSFEKPEKAVCDILRLRKLMWQLHQFLKQRLNGMSERDPDYTTLEAEYSNMKKANVFVFAIIQMLEKGINVFQTTIANPIGPISLN